MPVAVRPERPLTAGPSKIQLRGSWGKQTQRSPLGLELLVEVLTLTLSTATTATSTGKVRSEHAFLLVATLAVQAFYPNSALLLSSSLGYLARHKRLTLQQKLVAALPPLRSGQMVQRLGWSDPRNA